MIQPLKQEKTDSNIFPSENGIIVYLFKNDDKHQIIHPPWEMNY